MNRKSVRLAGIVLVLTLCIGCGKALKEKKVAEPASDAEVNVETGKTGGMAQLANPYKSVDNGDAFKDQLGIALDVDSECTDVSYVVIAGDLAQIKFKYKDCEYCLRADKKTDEEFGANGNSGIYGDFIPANLLVDVDADEVQAGKIGEDTMLLMWEKNGNRYSLSSSNGIDFNSLLDTFDHISF